MSAGSLSDKVLDTLAAGGILQCVSLYNPIDTTARTELLRNSP